LQALNYHKYVFVPKPVRSGITESTSAASNAPRDADSACSSVEHVPNAAPSTAEKSTTNDTDSGETHKPIDLCTWCLDKIWTPGTLSIAAFN